MIWASAVWICASVSLAVLPIASKITICFHALSLNAPKN